MNLVTRIAVRLALIPLELLGASWIFSWGVCAFMIGQQSRTSFFFTHTTSSIEWRYCILLTAATAVALHARLWIGVCAGDKPPEMLRHWARAFAWAVVQLTFIAVGRLIGYYCPVFGPRTADVMTLLAIALWCRSVLRLLAAEHRTDGGARRGPSGNLRRGAKLVSSDEVIGANAAAEEGSDGVYWGGGWRTDRQAKGHFAAVGATGGGKTVLIRLMMQSVLPSVGRRGDFRAVVYDAKQDCFPILTGMGVTEDRLRVLNPFDARSFAWDIAADVTTPALANEVATVLIPDEKGDHNPFYTKAARELVAGVMTGLMMSSPGTWTLRDVVCILPHRERMKALFAANAQTKDLISDYLEGDPRTYDNVKVTVRANVATLRPIAALWDACPRKLSLRRWVKEGTILVLGNDESLRASIDAVNRVLFHLITKLLLNQEECEHPRTWVFLDEVKEAGHLQGLPGLITKGRSKGVRVVLGFQDIEGMRAVWGREQANELASLPANKAFVHLDSPHTAQWASQVVGEVELLERTMGHNLDAQGSVTRTLNHSIVKRDAIMASEFLSLTPPAELKIEGYCIAPGVGAYRLSLDAGPLLKPRSSRPSHLPRPDTEQLMRPFDDADLRRLKLPASATEHAAYPEVEAPAQPQPEVPREEVTPLPSSRAKVSSLKKLRRVKL